MFGWEPPIDLATIKDDLTNLEIGFSFVTHPENQLQDAYFELCKRACTARHDSLSRRGNWHWGTIFKYLKKEEALREYLGLGLSTLCGQTPRWPEVSSVWCTNGEFGARGIYIYNGSMIYLTRHHKAKKITNREFIVARFLPAPFSHPCYIYLVWIRQFVDLPSGTPHPVIPLTRSAKKIFPHTKCDFSFEQFLNKSEAISMEKCLFY
jgi:hypothetical protein